SGIARTAGIFQERDQAVAGDELRRVATLHSRPGAERIRCCAIARAIAEEDRVSADHDRDGHSGDTVRTFGRQARGTGGSGDSNPPRSRVLDDLRIIRGDGKSRAIAGGRGSVVSRPGIWIRRRIFDSPHADVRKLVASSQLPVLSSQLTVTSQRFRRAALEWSL